MTPKQRASIRAMFGGKCAYCGIELPEKGWHADHVEPVYRKWRSVWSEQKKRWITESTGEFWRPENHREDNYFPSCAKCNIEKGACNLETFRRVIEQKIRVLRDNSSAFRHAERFGMVAIVKEKIVFHFETFAATQGKQE